MNADDGELHDILIIGGGLVGASLAIALDGLGLRMGLVEAALPDSMPEVFDQRNLSFAEATVNALSTLGVMRHLRAPTGPITRIHVSRRGDFGRTLLEAARYGRSEFGRVVVARDFGLALEARLAELHGLQRYMGSRFVASDAGNADARVVRIATPQGERTLHTRLLVAADGTHSHVRTALGIDSDVHDYRQTLFVARVRAERAPDGTAFERFGPDGPSALLPRGDRHFGLVHAVPRDQADTVAMLDAPAFLHRAQAAFGWRVGRLLDCGPRTAYPAIRSVTRALVATRAVLVGNAAQTVHPIGAQGFNLGLRDALTLAETVRDACGNDLGRDCGDATLLARYAARRQDDRARTLEFSDGLVRLTSRESDLLRPLRGLGLLAVDRLPSLQARLVGGAMGYRGDVPDLCRRTP